MKKLRANINRFNFGQLTSNSDGKTSSSGTAGLYIVGIGGLCFFLGCIKLFFVSDADILSQSIILVGIGSALLGYRKSRDSRIPDLDITDDTTELTSTQNSVNDQITDSVTSGSSNVVYTEINNQNSSIEEDPKNFDQINS